MSIRTKTHLWWAWLRIAVRNAADAQKSRIHGVVPRSFESADSARLSFEFEYALTAVVATAFAMEALSKEIKGAGLELNTTRFTKRAKTNAGFYVGHHIVQAFGLSGSVAALIPQRMEALFVLRNDVVHFESEWRDGLHSHPSGTSTGYELTLYTVESSVEAVQLGLDVVRQCAAAASAATHDAAANDAANEMPGVLGMLEETIRADGLTGLSER